MRGSRCFQPMTKASRSLACSMSPIRSPRQTAALGPSPSVQRRTWILDHVAAHGIVRPSEWSMHVQAGDGHRPYTTSACRNPDTLCTRRSATSVLFVDRHRQRGFRARLTKPKPTRFVGVDHDLDAFARTIQRWLTLYGRWNSPKFIIGEKLRNSARSGS